MNGKNRNKENRFYQSKKIILKEEKIINARKLIKDIESVDVDKAYLSVLLRIVAKKSFFARYNTVWRYAAILAIPLTLFSLWIVWRENLEQNTKEIIANTTSVQEINCPVGLRSKIILPDGSEVLLNSGSSLKYSLPFENNEERKITLSGEAFLNVMKKKDVPFVVQCKNVRVKVLGTQFNFKSYEDDDNVEVALKEGSVRLDLISDKKKSPSLTMKPGDYFLYSSVSDKICVEHKNLDDYFAWIANKLVFNDTPISEMEKTLERWYGVEIEIVDKSIENYKFSTTFNNESLDQVLELLQISSPISVKYIRAKSNDKLKSKVLIYKKKERLKTRS